MSGGGRVFWAVQGLLVGALALLSGISLKREAAIHSLNRSVSYHMAKVKIFQPAREARRLAQRAERPRRGLSALWASWRASAQAVTLKWQLRATSPMNTSSSAGENGFSAKNGS